jgi:hypothetical protein
LPALETRRRQTHDDANRRCAWVQVPGADASAGNYQRYTITTKGNEIVVKRGDQEAPRIALPAEAKARAPFGLRDTGAAMELMNLYAREL